MAQSPLEPITGPRAWRGPDMAARPDEWTHVLSAGQIDELDAAVEAVLARDFDILAIKPEDFPLPGLAAVLRKVRAALRDGPGFALLRGLPVERYDRRQAAIAFFGIGAHLGQAVSQNAKGHALGHVRDLGFDKELTLARGYQTSAALHFHTDPTDVVGLLSLRTAAPATARSGARHNNSRQRTRGDDAA